MNKKLLPLSNALKNEFVVECNERRTNGLSSLSSTASFEESALRTINRPYSVVFGPSVDDCFGLAKEGMYVLPANIS
jgi:hypothetical protein